MLSKKVHVLVFYPLLNWKMHGETMKIHSYTLDLGKQWTDQKMSLARACHNYSYKNAVGWDLSELLGKNLPLLEVSYEWYKSYYLHKKHHHTYRDEISLIINIIIIIGNLSARLEIAELYESLYFHENSYPNCGKVLSHEKYNYTKAMWRKWSELHETYSIDRKCH